MLVLFEKRLRKEILLKTYKMETASTSARRTALATLTTWDHLEPVPGGEPASPRALGTSAVGFPRSAKSATRSRAVQNPPNDKILIKLIQLSELEKVARKTLLQHNKYHNIVFVIDNKILPLYFLSLSSRNTINNFYLEMMRGTGTFAES